MLNFERNSAKQVHEVLEKLDANKAPGYDALPIEMIGARRTSYIAYPLYKLFNVCIETRKWPDE